jgi:hypothetical protein
MSANPFLPFSPLRATGFFVVLLAGVIWAGFEIHGAIFDGEIKAYTWEEHPIIFTFYLGMTALSGASCLLILANYPRVMRIWAERGQRAN